VKWTHIAHGKPQQNGFIESFIGKLRDEMLIGSPTDQDSARDLVALLQ
jgi:transposase InsO family protein